MILITGVTGKLGSKVFEQLQGSGEDLRLLVRDRTRAPKVSGIEIVEGDYSDISALKRAFSGVDKAFIVSGHARPMERAMLHRHVFQAAHESAVSYIVYTSFQGAAEDADFSMARDHHQSEIYLKESGLHYTALRNSFYAETAHEHVNENGVFLSPTGDGRVAWVTRDDIADVAVSLLQNPPEENEVLDVSGPAAPKLSELAEILSDVSGLDISYADESFEDGLAWRTKAAEGYGLVDWDLEAWWTGVVAMGTGEAGVVSDTVERLTGHKATSLRELYVKQPELIRQLRLD